MPSIRISTPRGNASSRPCPHTGQRSPTRSSSWRHASRSAPAYASAPRRPWPGRWPPRLSASLPAPPWLLATLLVVAVWGTSVASAGAAPLPPSPAPTTGAVSTAGAWGAWGSLPNSSVRNRRRLVWASCKANRSQTSSRTTCTSRRRSSALKASLSSRSLSASPSAGLRFTTSGRFMVGDTSARDHTGKRSCAAWETTVRPSHP